MKKSLLAVLLLYSVAVYAQSSSLITIDSIYEWTKNNYPLVKRAGLIAKANEYTIANIQKGYYPNISLNAQASYQSDVTSIKAPAVNIEPLDKDQYKATIDVNQVIYDGGRVQAQRQVQQTTADLELANLEKDLFTIREQVNQLFFGALLLQLQLEQNTILINDLSETKQRVQAALDNGVAYKADVDQVQSEILLQSQRRIELTAGRTAYLQMLSAFTGKIIDASSVLVIPGNVDDNNPVISNRPEIKGFDFQRKLYDSRLSLLNVQTRPRLSAFVQGGYGKPGLNMLKNSFDWLYIGGLRLSWNIHSFYTLKNEKNLLINSRKEVDVQEETFLFNTNLNIIQENTESKKMNELLRTDDEITRLIENIRSAAKIKYENGVITLNDYLKEISAVSQARLNSDIHKIQALSNQYQRKYTLGN